ncbi:hypothetical protein Tco_0764237 [Tanacetum coccineum]
MSITKEQQQALDDALVPREQRLTIGSCNYRLSTTFKPKEPTFQVALDVLSLTPFYQAFLITASVPAIYMQEFWNTASYPSHHQIKMNKKSYSFDLETSRKCNLDILELSSFSLMSRLICYLNLGEHLLLSSTNVLVEDLVYQIENKESRKNKYLYYPRFTKVIINHFMSQDQSILRRNKVDWHMANDDPILTTMRFIPQHEVVQKYGAILPDYLTTQAMKESEAYKTYHALATGKVQPKPKYVRRSSRTKTDDVPKPSSGKRVKATAKVANGSSAHEGTGVKPGVPDVPTYRSDDEEEIPWKSSDEDDNDDNEDDDDDQGVPDDDQGDDNDSKRTVSDTKGDDFVHPKFTSHDTEERHDEEDKDEESFDPRVQTPSHYEPSDDEANDDLAQSGYAEEEEVNVEQTFKANINLEGRDAEMTDAPKTTQVIEDTHVTLTPVNPEGQQQSSSVSSGFISNMLNPNPDTGIDSVLNVETTSLVDVPVTSQATTTLPQPSNPLIALVQQKPTPTLATTPSSLLLNLPNFGSLFGFDDRLKKLEADFSEFKQTNQ